MPLILDGTNGVSGVNGVNATPAVRGGDANTGFVFGTDIIQVIEGGSESARFDASGNLLVGVTSANANGGVLQLKSGITFPATQVTSTDANTLDDYEEGSWTPTITPGAGAITSYTAGGSYTKIGRQVTLQITYTITNNGTGAGYILIGGIPIPGITNSGASIGKEIAVVGVTAASYLTNTTTLLAVTYNNGYPGGAGQTWLFTTVYYVS